MDVYEMLKEFHTSAKEPTIKLYARVLQTLKGKMSGDSMYNFLEDFDKVLPNLSENCNSRKTQITAIVIMLKLKKSGKDIIKKYKDEQQACIKEVNDHYKSGDKSDRQSENWMTLEDLESIRAQLGERYEEIKGRRFNGDLKPSLYEDLQEYPLLSLQLKYPIRNDLHEAQVLSNAKYQRMSKEARAQNNMIVLKRDSGSLILNDYKTKGVYGQKVIELDKDITHLLHDFLKFRSKHGWESPWFLLNTKKDPMNSNMVTKAFNRIFKPYGKAVSTSMIRHIVLTEKFGETMKEAKEMADMMGHSVKTQQEKYVKNDD